MAVIKSDVVAAPKSLAQIGNECLKDRGYRDVLIRENPAPHGNVGFNFFDNSGHKIGNGMVLPADSIVEHKDNLKEYIGGKIDAYASMNNLKSTSVAMKE